MLVVSRCALKNHAWCCILILGEKLGLEGRISSPLLLEFSPKYPIVLKFRPAKMEMPRLILLAGFVKADLASSK